MCHIANRKEEDVNAICYSKENPNLVFSGGDDGILTCWDSRLFGSPDSPVGYLGEHFKSRAFENLSIPKIDLFLKLIHSENDSNPKIDPFSI